MANPEFVHNPGQSTGAEFDGSEAYRVGILTAYDPEIAAGIGRLMPDLDPGFSGEPTPQGKLEAIIADPQRCQIIATGSDGSVVAAATMNTLVSGTSAEGWLEDFIVHESARSKTGVAQRMYNQMGSWALENGHAQFSYGTETTRAAAVKFYDRQPNIIFTPDIKHLTAQVADEPRAPRVQSEAYATTVTKTDGRAAITATSSASGDVIAAVDLNTLMGAGKQNEGWFDNFVVAALTDRAEIADQLWREIEDWCREQGLSQFSFAMSEQDQQLMSFAKERAHMDETALHYTQPVG